MMIELTKAELDLIQEALSDYSIYCKGKAFELKACNMNDVAYYWRVCAFNADKLKEKLDAN